VDTFGVRQIPELIFPLSTKDRQTYFGALDYQPSKFIFRSIHMEIHQILSSLLIIYKRSALGKKIALIWDGAGYHKKIIDEIKKRFLASVNDNHLPDDGKLLVFIYLMPQTGRRCLVTGKNFLRKFWPQNFLCYQIGFFSSRLNHQNLIF